VITLHFLSSGIHRASRSPGRKLRPCLRQVPNARIHKATGRARNRLGFGGNTQTYTAPAEVVLESEKLSSDFVAKIAFLA